MNSIPLRVLLVARKHVQPSTALRNTFAAEFKHTSFAFVMNREQGYRPVRSREKSAEGHAAGTYRHDGFGTFQVDVSILRTPIGYAILCKHEVDLLNIALALTVAGSEADPALLGGGCPLNRNVQVVLCQKEKPRLPEAARGKLGCLRLPQHAAFCDLVEPGHIQAARLFGRVAQIEGATYSLKRAE